MKAITNTNLISINFPCDCSHKYWEHFKTAIISQCEDSIIKRVRWQFVEYHVAHILLFCLVFSSFLSEREDLTFYTKIVVKKKDERDVLQTRYLYIRRNDASNVGWAGCVCRKHVEKPTSSYRCLNQHMLFRTLRMCQSDLLVFLRVFHCCFLFFFSLILSLSCAFFSVTCVPCVTSNVRPINIIIIGMGASRSDVITCMRYWHLMQLDH